MTRRLRTSLFALGEFARFIILIYIYIYTYKTIPPGTPKLAPKWVPAAPGPGGAGIEKTLEFIMRERKSWRGPAPLFGKFRGVGFGGYFGRLWGSNRAPFGSPSGLLWAYYYGCLTGFLWTTLWYGF